MRVLTLRALGLGDALTAVPALRGLRRAFPDATLQLAGPAGPGGLIRDAGIVDEVVPTQPLSALPRGVGGADLAVNLHGRGPQSTAVLAATRPRRLLAFGADRGPSWRPDEHEVDRWCRLLVESGIPADPDDLLLPAPAVRAPVTGATVVHVGAAQPSRRWPLDRWAAVVRGLTRDGHEVVLTGGPDERPAALAVARSAGLPQDAALAGRTGLPELAALVSAARLLVSVDTGVAHLATAYGTPSVVLFGPTPPALWGPPADAPQHRVLWAGRAGDNFAADVDPGLLLLSPEQVLQEVATLSSTCSQSRANRSMPNRSFATCCAPADSSAASA